MNLKKLHQGDWLIDAVRSPQDPGILDIKVLSIDGHHVLEYRVSTISSQPLHNKGNQSVGCGRRNDVDIKKGA